MRLVTIIFSLLVGISPAATQIPPNSTEVAAYSGLHAAAHAGNTDEIGKLITGGAEIDKRDAKKRTSLHVAAYASNEDAVRALAKAGADLNVLEYQAYDVVTIASVANDLDMLKTVLELGASASNITSPYDGTALIAAAHLGHHEVVKMLIDAGAPLDHVNNLNWTALIEVVVLGDGGSDHLKSARHLVEAGADKSIGDRGGVTPLEHAKARGYAEMVKVLSE